MREEDQPGTKPGGTILFQGRPTPPIDRPEPTTNGDSTSEPTDPGASSSVTHADLGMTPLEDRLVLRLKPGDVVPNTRYRILRWIGDGGMGVVYEAEHVEIERHVALKILKPEFSANQRAIDSFRDEARAATRVGSTGIVQIHDLIRLPDARVVVAMELLRGETLADICRRGPIEPGRVIGILRQVCKALQAAHEAGIIHRDVKPENIMLVTDRGRHDTVKVLDFGIAAMTADEDGQQSFGAGTPHYMAPEQASGLPFDGRLDQYGLGCTAYAMLTGQLPFRGNTTEELIEQHLTKTPEAPSTVSPGSGIPNAVDRVVLKCLAKRPEDRFADMRDLEAALCEAEIDAKLQSSWDDLELPDIEAERRDFLLRNMPEPGWSFAGGGRMWIAAAAVVAVLGLGAALVWPGTDDVTEVAVVEQLTNSARAAAAGAYFVYPPSDHPDQATAYTEVLELERLRGAQGELGSERAENLREEFADTLVRLGDRYWEQEGGQAFAIDYYAQALVFSPGHPRARERATLTPGELAQLRQKADELSFSEGELVAAEPLLALAESDEGAKRKKLEKLVHNGQRRRASTTTEKLSTILEDSPDPAGSTTRRAASPAPPQTVDGDPEPLAQDELSPSSPTEDRRDVTAARELAKEGRKALKRSDWQRAEGLFTQALAKDHRSVPALVGLSDVYFERSKYRKAVTYVRKAVGLAPSNAEYRVKLGDAYFKVLRYDDARKQYAKAAAMGHARASNRLAMVDAKLGK